MIKIYFYTFFLIALLSCQNKQEEKVDSDLQNIEQSNLHQKPKKATKEIDLEKVDYKSYCGKTLGELLENETLKNYSSYSYIDEPPFVLALIIIEYPNTKKSLSVYVGDLVYQKNFSEDMSRNWSFELLKKEKFEIIDIIENYDYQYPLFTCDCVDRTKEKF